MRRAKSKEIVSEDPKAILWSSNKNLYSTKVLSFRGEITTWQYDAKNCAILYFRMIKFGVFSSRLHKNLQNWAGMLLFYARHFGFTDSYSSEIIIGRPTIKQSYHWLVELLNKIKDTSLADLNEGHSIDKFFINAKVQTEFCSAKRCALLYAPSDKYKFMLEYAFTSNGVKNISRWFGDKSLNKMCIKIERSIKKHRNPLTRKDLLKTIKDKEYGKEKLKLRPGRLVV